MIDKIKSHVNKKYAIVSLYVIATVSIIFIIACVIFQIENIFKSVASALNYIGKMLTPIFVGFIIAYITNPMVEFIEKMFRKIKIFKPKNEKKYRTIAVFTCIILIILAIFLLLNIFIFSITRQISNMKTDKIVYIIKNYIDDFSNSLKGIESRLNDFNIQSKIIDQYAERFSTALTNTLTSFANNLLSNTMNISTYIYNIFFGLIIGIYLLLDKDEFIEHGNKFLKAMFSEKAEKKIKSYLSDINYVCSGYVRGTLLDALIMGATLSVALSVIGIKFGILIGILAGICKLIPYFGSIVAFSGTIIFGLINAQYTKVIIAVIVLIIIDQIDGNVIQPKLIGRNISLKPILILISLIIGEYIGGVLGMVIAVPVMALIKLFLKRGLEERLRKKAA